VLDPLTATVLALETRGPNGTREQAIMISCDVLFIRKSIQERLRKLIESKLPDFDVDKLFMDATHTHTPTEKAIRGGGYSADKFVVGPQGGQVLVDETVRRINTLWD
jgi:hypothetical protein